jgi:phosphoglycerate dehydrogenase-like enzyme
MSFEVGLTCELRGPDGEPLVDIGLAELDQDPGISWRFLDEHPHELRPADVADLDAILVWDAGVSAETLSSNNRLALVARLGVGLDDIDVEACTQAGVLVTITSDAVRRPVASGALAFMLALSHRVPELDRIVRAGHWYEEVRGAAPPITGSTVAILGFGNIGREVARLLAPWEPTIIAFDPYASAPAASSVEMVPLEEALARGDFVVVTCPLTDETHHLINADALAAAKPGSLIVNVARGPIIDTNALVEALREGRVGGAALDVLEEEPPPADHPLLQLDNVILAPHAIALTDDFNLAVGRSALSSVRQVARGERPALAVRPDVADGPLFKGRRARQKDELS